MATLIFDEPFTGSNRQYYVDNGWCQAANNAAFWSTDPNTDGLKIEHDVELNRNVLYSHMARLEGGRVTGDVEMPTTKLARTINTTNKYY